ncbi:MAG: DUF1580 domain-containing protein [Planctomycetes bacterium]|nr:DUF1580 domain-containing protein [Planctomycetota bacterium]
MTTDAKSRAPWWTGESPIPLGAVPDHLPPRADGRQRSVATIYRWSSIGAHGVRLRRYRVGPRGWFTTREELHRFAAALTSLAGGDL